MRDTVLSRVLALQRLSLTELRRQYAQLFPDEKSVPANKPYLQRRIAYRLQELAYSGLSSEAQERLHGLIQQHDPINHKPERPVEDRRRS